MQQILIIGAGFAGVWSALSAARVREEAGLGPDALAISVVAPAPSLDLRPRLYEQRAGEMTAPLGELFAATDIRFIPGLVTAIHSNSHMVETIDAEGQRQTLTYDRLVLAPGSRLHRPAIPGIESALSIDQRDEAARLERHLHALKGLPDSPARNTVIVIGGGFTGIELATELPARMKAILGDQASTRIIVIEREAVIGPELGAGPRPAIQAALDSQGVECLLSMSVTEIDERGVTLTSGERIESLSVIWAGGMRANILTEQISARRDSLGRIHVDRNLRVPEAPDIFATGDAAFAATDDAGNHALMSCQHAMTMGKASGTNAAADLLGRPLRPYRQERYGTCLDLGPWGAVVTEGWDRRVKESGPAAKQTKQFINGVAISPPPADRAEALRLADPAPPVSA